MSLAERMKPSAPVGLKHLLSAEAIAFLLKRQVFLSTESSGAEWLGKAAGE
jgi:hypothetical protein